MDYARAIFLQSNTFRESRKNCYISVYVVTLQTSVIIYALLIKRCLSGNIRAYATEGRRKFKVFRKLNNKPLPRYIYIYTRSVLPYTLYDRRSVITTRRYDRNISNIKNSNNNGRLFYFKEFGANCCGSFRKAGRLPYAYFNV